MNARRPDPVPTFTAERIAIALGSAMFAVVLFFASNFVIQVQAFEQTINQSLSTVRLESVTRIATLEAQNIALAAQVSNLEARVRAIEHFSTVNVNK